MWSNVKAWLNEKTTWAGMATAIVLIVSFFAPTYAELVTGILAAFGLVVPEKLLGGKK